MNHTPSLNSVSKQFTTWRETYDRSRHTPSSLKQQAVELKSHYPISKIINTLGINHQTLKRWSLQNKKSQANQFISLPALLPEKNNASTQCLATCEFPNGIKVTLTHEILNTNLLSLIYQLKSEGAL